MPPLIENQPLWETSLISVFDHPHSENVFCIANLSFLNCNFFPLSLALLLMTSKKGFIPSSLHPLLRQLKKARRSVLNRLFLRLNTPSFLSLSQESISSRALTALVASSHLPTVCQYSPCTVEPQTGHSTL